MTTLDKNQQQELSVEEKAKEIGNKIDAEELEKVEYDIKEEDDDRQEQENDERLGKHRDDFDADHKKHLSNREKRQLRKKKVKEKFDAKDAIIRQQQEQLNALVARLNEVDGRLTDIDRNKLETGLANTKAAYAAAEKKYTEAFAQGDATKSAEAMREMYQYQRNYEQLTSMAARQQTQPVHQVNPVEINKANQWAEKNSWFKPNSGDDDSAIAEAIAAKLVRDGYDPKSDTYWEELDNRLAARGIGDADDDYEDEEETQTQSQQIRQVETPRRKSPPVAGGSNRGDIKNGKIAVTLPKALIEHMKQTGKWDDPVAKDRIIKEYQRIKTEGAR